MKVTVGASEDYQIVVDITPFDLESRKKFYLQILVNTK